MVELKRVKGIYGDEKKCWEVILERFKKGEFGEVVSLNGVYEELWEKIEKCDLELKKIDMMLEVMEDREGG